MSQIPKFKVIFIGDIQVGKTSIIKRFITDSFEGTYQNTVGIDFVVKTIEHQNPDVTFKLQLWDTAGHERFKSLIPTYIKESIVALVVYDITQPKSFENVDEWVKLVRDTRGDDIFLVLVGNKVDLLEDAKHEDEIKKEEPKENKEQITKEEEKKEEAPKIEHKNEEVKDTAQLDKQKIVTEDKMRTKAQLLKMKKCFEVSAKSGKNINEMFSSLVDELIPRIKVEDKVNVAIEHKPKPIAKKCKC